jgi:3-hydroxybutyryl-CoA dehydratase
LTVRPVNIDYCARQSAVRVRDGESSPRKGGPSTVESKTIDDLAVGQAIERRRVVSADHIAAFARLSGDFNPVHVDEEFARRTPFGRTIAHGPMALALAAGILGMELPGVGTIAISNVIRYRRPIFTDDEITTRVEVAEIDAAGRRVTMALKWTNQVGELVCDGEAVVRPPKVRAL